MKLTAISAQATPIRQNNTQASPSFGMRNPLKYPGCFLDKPKNMRLTGNWFVDTVRKAPKTLALWSMMTAAVTGCATKIATSVRHAAQEKVRIENLVKSGTPIQIAEEAGQRLKRYGFESFIDTTNKLVKLTGAKSSQNSSFLRVADVHAMYGLEKGTLNKHNELDKVLNYQMEYLRERSH